MGNQVGSDDVVGRDKLIAKLWKWLHKKSIVLTDERRIGKTSVITKMEEEPIDEMKLIYWDLEKVESMNRFIEVLFQKLKPLMTNKAKSKYTWKALLTDLGGTEAAGIIKFPEGNPLGWQSMLEKIFENICANNEGFTLVLLFDELPYMLQKLQVSQPKDSGQSQALVLLDTLRALREQYPNNLRMVFTGSVGLHHVLNDLRNEQIASEPLNDMEKVEVGRLEVSFSEELVRNLIKKESVEFEGESDSDLVEMIASSCDHVPFYIEKVIARLAEMEHQVCPNDVKHIVATHLADDKDIWEMEHFRSRLSIYYKGSVSDTNSREVENAKIAATILDILSLVDQPQSINHVWSALKSQLSIDDRDTVIKLLNSLGKDHYLKCNTQKHYSFKFDLIKRWWVLAQGLSNEK